ncbi:MAG: hypothetical protein U5N86_08085 [Planctomycetota bacterium]|nr:hypothetical protein [Planctomycetota bacterium]
MKILRYVFLVCAFCLIGSFVCADEIKDRDYRRADNAFEAELYDFAHKHFRIFTQKYPQSERLPVVYLKLGISSYYLALSAKDETKEKYLENAREELNTVLDKYPLSVVELDVHYWLGEVWMASEDAGQGHIPSAQSTQKPRTKDLRPGLLPFSCLCAVREGKIW